MGRKASDSVTEHRITLGDFERKQIQGIIATQKANVAIDGVTATFQAAGSALAGGGMLWAAIGLMGWFGGGKLLDALKGTGNATWDWINDTVNPFTDFIQDSAITFDSEKWKEINRSEEHTSELQSPCNLVCRLLLEKKKNNKKKKKKKQCSVNTSTHTQNI